MRAAAILIVLLLSYCHSSVVACQLLPVVSQKKMTTQFWVSVSKNLIQDGESKRRASIEDQHLFERLNEVDLECLNVLMREFTNGTITYDKRMQLYDSEEFGNLLKEAIGVESCNRAIQKWNRNLLSPTGSWSDSRSDCITADMLAKDQGLPSLIGMAGKERKRFRDLLQAYPKLVSELRENGQADLIELQNVYLDRALEVLSDHQQARFLDVVGRPIDFFDFDPNGSIRKYCDYEILTLRSGITHFYHKRTPEEQQLIDRGGEEDFLKLREEWVVLDHVWCALIRDRGFADYIEVSDVQRKQIQKELSPPNGKVLIGNLGEERVTKLLKGEELNSIGPLLDIFTESQQKKIYQVELQLRLSLAPDGLGLIDPGVISGLDLSSEQVSAISDIGREHQRILKKMADEIRSREIILQRKFKESILDAFGDDTRLKLEALTGLPFEEANFADPEATR